MKKVYVIEDNDDPDANVYIYDNGFVAVGNGDPIDKSALYNMMPFLVPLPVDIASHYLMQFGGKCIPLTDEYGPLEDYYPTREEIDKGRESGAIV